MTEQSNEIEKGGEGNSQKEKGESMWPLGRWKLLLPNPMCMEQGHIKSGLCEGRAQLIMCWHLVGAQWSIGIIMSESIGVIKGDPGTELLAWGRKSQIVCQTSSTPSGEGHHEQTSGSCACIPRRCCLCCYTCQVSRVWSWPETKEPCVHQSTAVYSILLSGHK